MGVFGVTKICCFTLVSKEGQELMVQHPEMKLAPQEEKQQRVSEQNLNLRYPVFKIICGKSFSV